MKILLPTLPAWCSRVGDSSASPAEQILTTQRTTVGYITLDDGPFFLELMNSPGWLKYIGDRSIDSVADATLAIENSYLVSYRDNGFGYYTIRLTDSQAPLGICGFLKRPDLDYPDFGFALLSQYQGQGFASEAGVAIFEYGVKTFGFQTVDAITKPENVKSARLLEQLGFRLEQHNETGEVEDLNLYRWQSAAPQ